jgi:hypothetical protein
MTSTNNNNIPTIIQDNNKDKTVKVEKISVMISGSPGSQLQQLTSDMILYETKNNISQLDKLPFITGTIKYDESSLYLLANRQYFKVLEFFFNRNEFEKRCNYMIEVGASTDEKNINKNIESNVKIMMTILFPTKFPAMRNFNDSFTECISKKGPDQVSYKLPFAISEEGNVGFGNKYSYIKLNNGEHTITKMLWLNDIINHTVYKDFIDDYRDYILKSNDRHKNLLIAISSAVTKLTKRFNEKEKNNLYLNNYITDIEKAYKEINEKKISTENNSSNMSSNLFDVKRKQYEDDIKNLSDNLNNFIGTDIENIENIENIKNIKTNEEKILSKEEENLIIGFYTSAINIKEIFDRIRSNDRSNLKISPEFKNKLDNIVKELRKIIISIKIKNNYITVGNNINTKIEGEEQDIIDELNTKYKYFIDFLKRINDLTFPNRVSTNDDLQTAIKDYAAGEDNNNFSILLDEIINIVLKNKNDNLKSIKLYNVGVSIINPNDDKLPRYEIYISFDLVQGRINDTNINKLKCYYTGTDLGTYVQNYFSKKNSYIAENSKIYIKKEDYEKDALYKNIKDTTILNSLPEARGELKQTENKKIGGYTYSSKKINKTNKTKKNKILRKK